MALERKAMSAAWAVSYGKELPPAPNGVSPARWAAMVKHTERQVGENS